MLSIRKIGVFGKTYRHLNRYRQILSVLFRYGFGDLVETLNIDQYLEIGLQMVAKNRREPNEKLSRAERVSMAIEELGPTFVKFGQILSTRPDLVPADFIPALSKLQDAVPPFSFESACRIIEFELGASISELFDTIDEKPFASASIGQVHRARLKTGDEVAVKVQRPKIRGTIEVDLEIMLHLATLMERHIEDFSFHRPVKIVEEFARSLEKEIDYRIEAAHMERIAENFLEDPTVYIPKVFRDFTKNRVITMEFIEGIKVLDMQRIHDAGLDPKLILRRGADIVLRQVFEHGFFHADPHPGNIFILPDNIVCLIDFGMVGSVDRRTRELFVELIDAVVHRKVSRTAQIFLKLSVYEMEPDLRSFERDVDDFLTRHLYKPMKDIEFGRMIQELLELSSRHHLRVPPDIFLMMKSIGAIENIGQTLDPDFNIFTHAEPFVRQIVMARYAPHRIAGEATEMAFELFDFFRRFPGEILEISKLLRKQRLSIQFEQKGFRAQLDTQDRVSNRISFSIIIAALIVGSSIIVNSKIPPLVYGISLFGILLFAAAAFMGIWLLIGIIRKGRL